MPVFAQTSGPEPETQAATSDPPPPPAQEDDPDRDVNLAQPDFTLASLPTTLRLPRFGSAFRVTHRFGRPLGEGDFGELLEDLFGLDSGALIGLEYRFGVFRGAQIGINRPSNQTIQFFGQYDIKNQRDGFPIGLAVHATAEGTNNFKDSYTPMIGVAVSRELGRYGAVYVEPMWVNNSNLLPTELVDDNDSVVMGLGARVRLLRNTYATFEATPRLTGYAPGVTLISFGFEQRAGGHTFQLNFSNGLGTTLAQVARGGTAYEDWYIGFNLSRKFY
jgi:hypothetical protein